MSYFIICAHCNRTEEQCLRDQDCPLRQEIGHPHQNLAPWYCMRCYPCSRCRLTNISCIREERGCVTICPCGNHCYCSGHCYRKIECNSWGKICNPHERKEKKKEEDDDIIITYISEYNNFLSC